MERSGGVGFLDILILEEKYFDVVWPLLLPVAKAFAPPLADAKALMAAEARKRRRPLLVANGDDAELDDGRRLRGEVRSCDERYAALVAVLAIMRRCNCLSEGNFGRV